jgi:hypothetical protein
MPSRSDPTTTSVLEIWDTCTNLSECVACVIDLPLRLYRALSPLPSRQAPSGSTWIHEIKHDGYRLMARRGPVGIRLITRRGNDWTTPRFPLVVQAVNHLKVRSCLIDGEVVCCDDKGVAAFHVLVTGGTSHGHSCMHLICLNWTAPICAENPSKFVRRRWRASCARPCMGCG